VAAEIATIERRIHGRTAHVKKADGWRKFLGLARSLPRPWSLKWENGRHSHRVVVLPLGLAWLRQHSTGGKERLPHGAQIARRTGLRPP
jgi:hypothetical protein